jgi:hypothetical protein
VPVAAAAEDAAEVAGGEDEGVPEVGSQEGEYGADGVGVAPGSEDVGELGGDRPAGAAAEKWAGEDEVFRRAGVSSQPNPPGAAGSLTAPRSSRPRRFEPDDPSN